MQARSVRSAGPGTALAFTKNVGVLMSGTAGSRAVGLLAAPILSRLYDPADFALLALVTSLAALLTRTSALSYDQAIPITRREAESANLFVVSLLLVLAIGLVLLIPALVLRDTLAVLFNNADLAAWIWSVPLFIIARGWIQVAGYFCVRNAWFAFISAAALAEGVVAAATKIGLAYAWEPSPGALLAGGLLGIGANVVVFAALRRLRPVSIGSQRVTRTRMLVAMKRYREFPIFNSWTTLLNAVSENINVLLFSAFFTPAIVGAYSFAHRTVSMPISYLGTHVSKVFLGHAADYHRQGRRLDWTMLRTTAVLLLIGLLPFGALGFFGRELFGFAFGPAWGDAGRYAEILAPALLFSFINGPATSLYSVLRRVGLRLAYTALYSAARLLAVIAAYLAFGDIEACLAWFTQVVVAFNVIYILMAWLLARPGRREPAPVALNR